MRSPQHIGGNCVICENINCCWLSSQYDWCQNCGTLYDKQTGIAHLPNRVQRSIGEKGREKLRYMDPVTPTTPAPNIVTKVGKHTWTVIPEDD